jgi:hypothetical protein
VQALAQLNISVAGFWRSFFAAIVALPIFAFALIPQYLRAADPGWFVAVEAVHYAAAWAAFPLVMIPVARFLRLTPRYIPYIIAVNWTSVLQLVLFLPLNVLALFGSLEGDGGAFLFTLALTLSCIYRYFIARVALETTLGTALALVALDVVLGLLLTGIFDQLYAASSSSSIS